MNWLRMIMVAVIAALFLCLFGCKKDPVGPPPLKNPREYAWKVDTLAYPGSLQTLMRSIWGSSSSNIYICGHNDQSFAKMYHWDGRGWTNVKLHVSEGGPFISLASLDGIFGLSPQDVYAVGALGPQFSPFLIHFNGTQWRRINVPNGQGLLSLWARSPSELWIGGYEGFLARYTGNQFIRDSLPYTFVNDTMQNPQITQITGNPSVTYLILGNAPDTLFFPIYYIYERAGSQWVVRDSSYEFARVFVSPGGKLYRFGSGGVQQRTGSTWTAVLSGLATVAMGADTDNNMYAVGYYGVPSSGRIYHYNGSDWFEFLQLRMNGVTFNSVWTDGKDVFVVGTTSGFPMKTIVLHGR